MNPSLSLFLRSNARHLAGLFAASLLVNVFLLAMPLFSMLVYDKAMGNEVHDTLWALAIGMMLLLAQEIALRMARVQLLEHAGARWDAWLDERLMRGVLAAPLSRALPVAELLNKLRELAATRDVLSAQALLPVADLPFLLMFLGAIALIGGPLVLIPLAAGGLILALSLASQRLGHDRQRAANEAQRAKLTALIDVLAARESLLGQPLAEAAQAYFRRQSQAGARAAARARWWSQTGQQAVPVLMSLASVAVLVAGVFRVEDQALSVGGLISVNMISSRVLAMVCSVAPVGTRWREFTRALASLGDSVDLHAPPLEAAHFSADALRSEGVHLQELSFGYVERPQAALDALSLSLRAGELVAVIGASGAGKSTLLRMLAGQVPPSAGRLVFGGHRIDDDAARRWLNHQAAHKTQDPCFLGGTLRDIVSGGDAAASDSSVITALRAAGLGPALERGELALNTVVGTNGAGLSGGQRQMVALAVAFHSRRSLLLLDEPTLGLDRAAQECVLRALRPLRAGRVMVVATHASEVIAEADRVIVLERGKVVADAPPQRLMPGLVRLSETAAPAAPAAPVSKAPAAATRLAPGGVLQ